MFGKYSPFVLYKEHKEEIDAYIRGDVYEGYRDNLSPPPPPPLSTGAIVAIVVVGLVLWVWALVITIMFWNNLPTWAKVIGVLGLVTGIGPVVTIIVVYIGNSVGPDKPSGKFGFNSY